MDFDYSPKTKELQKKLLQFMDDHIYPAESQYMAELAANTQAGKRWTPLQTVENLKAKAQAVGLWNLFMPVDTAEASGYHGAGLTNAEYAPLANYQLENWFGLFAPAGTPDAVQQSSTARRPTPATWKPLRAMAPTASRPPGSSPCSKASSAQPSP